MRLFFLLAMLGMLTACQKELSSETGSLPHGVPGTPGGYQIIFKFRFDSTQQRLNNIGQPSDIPAGNAAQSPVFNGMSAHYVELAPNALTPLGKGAVLYKAEETSMGGSTAIDFEKSKVVGNGESFFSMPIKNIPPGSYDWLRISLAYQNYDVKYNVDTVLAGFPVQDVFTGTVASFIGYNNYIKSYTLKTDTLTVNANRKQGYWGFEGNFSVAGVAVNRKTSGQAPEGATTVVNPLAATSPIPAGSCVVTAAFEPGKLVVTGHETKDIVVEVSLSTNKSFEWQEVVPNGLWDIFKGERIVDMGIRGMVPRWQ